MVKLYVPFFLIQKYERRSRIDLQAAEAPLWLCPTDLHCCGSSPIVMPVNANLIHLRRLAGTWKRNHMKSYLFKVLLGPLAVSSLLRTALHN